MSSARAREPFCDASASTPGDAGDSAVVQATTHTRRGDVSRGTSSAARGLTSKSVNAMRWPCARPLHGCCRSPAGCFERAPPRRPASPLPAASFAATELPSHPGYRACLAYRELDRDRLQRVTMLPWIVLLRPPPHALARRHRWRRALGCLALGWTAAASSQSSIGRVEPSKTRTCRGAPLVITLSRL